MVVAKAKSFDSFPLSALLTQKIETLVIAVNRPPLQVARSKMGGIRNRLFV